MKIGIAGSSERRSFWEKHLRPFSSIREVIHANNVDLLGDADACILLDTGYQDALKTLKRGCHTFLVSRLEPNSDIARKVQLTAEESGVSFMISNWSVFSSATRWMMQQLESPEYIHINRIIPWEMYLASETTFNVCWTEELALCLKWISSSIHHIEVNTVRIDQNRISALDVFIRFDNSSTAILHVSLAGSDEYYTRQAGGRGQDLWCDVLHRKVRWGRSLENGGFSYRNMDLTYTEPSEQALALFLKSVQQKEQSAFNGFDLLRFSKAAETVSHHLKSGL